VEFAQLQTVDSGEDDSPWVRHCISHPFFAPFHDDLAGDWRTKAKPGLAPSWPSEVIMQLEKNRQNKLRDFQTASASSDWQSGGSQGNNQNS